MDVKQGGGGGVKQEAGPILSSRSSVQLTQLGSEEKGLLSKVLESFQRTMVKTYVLTM